MLKRRGITRVRPLLGGIDAWRELDYPLERVVLKDAEAVSL
jgi:3-mercaptopyruvate sulfurtransferase SseA